MSFTLPEGDAMVSNATDPTTTMLILTWPLAFSLLVYLCALRSEKKRKYHQGHPPTLLGQARVHEGKPINFYLFRTLTYFAKINFNFFRVVEGIVLGSVRIACDRAAPQLHDRPLGVAATVSRTTLQAFFAFFSRSATI